MCLTEEQQAKHSSNPSWSGKTVETSVRSAKTQITSTEIMCDMWTPPKLRILRELKKIRKCKLLCALCQRRKTIENLRKPRKSYWNHLRHLGKRQRANVGHCTLFSEQLHIHRFHCRRKGTPKKRSCFQYDMRSWGFVHHAQFLNILHRPFFACQRWWKGKPSNRRTAHTFERAVLSVSHLHFLLYQCLRQTFHHDFQIVIGSVLTLARGNLLADRRPVLMVYF